MGNRIGGQHKPYAPKPFMLIYLALVIFGASIAFAAYLGILWTQSLPPLGSSFQEKESQARLEAIKVALTTVAGLAAASGLYVGYRRQRVEESNSSREQDRVFTERFGAAAALLGNENAAVRLAGVQSLARLADDSIRDRYTCLSALCSYLRLPVRLTEDASDPPESHRSRSLRREQWLDPDEWDVRRNALRLLLDRLDSDAPEPWDLRDAVLIDPNFSIVSVREGIDARRAILLGAVTLTVDTFESLTLFEDCLFSSSLDVIGSNPDVRFTGSEVAGLFTFCMTHASLIYPWGLMPVFERCSFRGGSRILTDLTNYISSRNFYTDTSLRATRLEASNVTLRLTDSSFFGSVLLSTHSLDVSGADFGEVDELEFITYEGSAELAPIEYDSKTHWPEGFDDP